MFEATFRRIMQALVEASVDTGVADVTSTVNWLDDSAKSWPPSPGGFENLIVEITAGTAEGQIRRIASNTATRLTFAAPMAVAPDATSQYKIGFFGRMTSDIGSWGAVPQTGADLTPLFQNLDVALSTRASQATLASVLAQLDVALSTRASQATVASILAALDVALSTRATEATAVKLIPIAKAQVFNTALPAADNNILGADIAPTNSPSFMQIYVCVAVAGILRVRRTRAAVTVSENLSDGQNLNINAAYNFTVPWRTGDTVNFWYSQTGGNILSLIVDEVGGG